MNNFKTLLLGFLTLISFSALAQTPDYDPNLNNSNPNTETAFLNYDYKFQQSGFEKMFGGPINIQPGIRGMMNFEFAEDYDYIFIFISDTFTEGISIAGKPVEFNNDMFETDTSYVFTEWNSRLLVFPVPDEMKGKAEIRPMIIGKGIPKESSYYLLVRKKRKY